MAGYRADTSPCDVDGSCIKWPWLQSLAVCNHSFVLKRGIRLVLRVTYQFYLNYLNSVLIKVIASLFQGSYTWAHIQVHIRPQQEIEPKVGGGLIFRSGPSFTRVQYNYNRYMDV